MGMVMEVEYVGQRSASFFPPPFFSLSLLFQLLP